MPDPAFISGNTKTTAIGYVNQRGQRSEGHRGIAGNGHMQRAYKMRCMRDDCGHDYGANGSDIFQRRCPRCDRGAPGIPY
jgi:hypothetical protein